MVHRGSKYVFVYMNLYCHNPNNNTTQPQHRINTVVGFGTKMTVRTSPTPHKLKPQITIY